MDQNFARFSPWHWKHNSGSGLTSEPFAAGAALWTGTPPSTGISPGATCRDWWTAWQSVQPTSFESWLLPGQCIA